MAGLTTLAALEGTWRLTREIVHDDGGRQVFEGTARFVRTGEALSHMEEGTLSGPAGQPSLKATRRYLWRVAEGRIEVLFEDGRPFHGFPAGALKPEASHSCPPDVYKVAYDFSEPDRWRATWRVDGPRKAYVMESIFRAIRADRRGRQTLASA